MEQPPVPASANNPHRDGPEFSNLLFLVAAAALALLFIGIHNAWDTVTYHVFIRKREQREVEPTAKSKE